MNLLQNNIVKNNLLDLNKRFYNQTFSINWIHELAPN